MPAFQRLSKEEIAKEFAKYMKKKKFVMSDKMGEFFQEYGMRPRLPVMLEILKIGFQQTTFIEAMLGFIPEEINTNALKGFCFYDVETKIAYFSDIVDIALFKLLSDREIRKIIK